MASIFKRVSFFRGSLIVLITMLMSACVTTERGGVGDRVETAKALRNTVQLARVYIREGQWQAAKKHLRTALEFDDSNAEIYEAMALVFQNTGEIELAEKNYKQSIKLNSEAARVRNNYAAFLYKQSRYKEAVKQLEQVVADTLYDKRSSAFVNLGRSYLEMDELTKARDAFRRAYLMNRKDIPLTFELADVHFQLKEYPIAQQYYDAYRQQVEQQPARALWLGIQLAEKFDNKDAVSSYGMALRNMYPTSFEFLEYKKAFMP
ncbi:MAG: type IV pilus assembly protein PilF [Oceanicoccus sp.]|jgi:type IV pilus assembly protein PilF